MAHDRHIQMNVQTPQKSEVISAIMAAICSELDAAERMAKNAQDEATHSDTKAEGKYDTRATEASYLARGQAQRILNLRELKSWYERFSPNQTASEIRIGALVLIENEDQEWLFLAPAGGGKVIVQGIPVLVVSPTSPMGRGMVDIEVGESFEVDTPRGVVEYEIVACT
ncbi:MAG: transcription elongation factor GreAB [Deltaproteobacteria bacterium]|nr:transcription elongation factor GreAB [Deltaproteobacteria bacterium]